MCQGLVVVVYVDGESGEVKGWDLMAKMDMCRTSAELECTLLNNQQGDGVPGVHVVERCMLMGCYGDSRPEGG